MLYYYYSAVSNLGCGSSFPACQTLLDTSKTEWPAEQLPACVYWHPPGFGGTFFCVYRRDRSRMQSTRYMRTEARRNREFSWPRPRLANAPAGQGTFGVGAFGRGHCTYTHRGARAGIFFLVSMGRFRKKLGPQPNRNSGGAPSVTCRILAAHTSGCCCCCCCCCAWCALHHSRRRRPYTRCAWCQHERCRCITAHLSLHFCTAASVVPPHAAGMRIRMGTDARVGMCMDACVDMRMGAPVH